MERNKIGNYLVMNGTELAALLHVQRQVIDQKVHGKKACERGYIVHNGVEYPFTYVGERTVIFYIEHFEPSRV